MLDFPTEVLEMILMHVDGVDLVRNCQRVSSTASYDVDDLLSTVPEDKFNTNGYVG